MKRKTVTTLTELVETHNMALALQRLQSSPYDSTRWRRALYHALAISSAPGSSMLEKIRIALELP